MNSAFAQATGPTPTSPAFPGADLIASVGDIATIVLAVVAVVALIVAWRHLGAVWRQMIAAYEQMETSYLQLETTQKQLETARKQLNELVENNRARLLFDLDSRWDSTEMVKARQVFRKEYDRIEALARSKDSMANAERLRQLISKEFHEHLQNLQKDEHENYQTLRMMIGFFETAGMLAKKGYVPPVDIIDLYAGAILRVHWAFKHHLEASRGTVTSVPGLYEHMLALGNAAIEWTNQRQRDGDMIRDSLNPINE